MEVFVAMITSNFRSCVCEIEVFKSRTDAIVWAHGSLLHRAFTRKQQDNDWDLMTMESRATGFNAEVRTLKKNPTDESLRDLMIKYGVGAHWDFEIHEKILQ